MRTYMAKPAEASLKRKWFVVDATDLPLGRLASKIAMVLSGKNKPEYTPHLDTGDFVIVINADKVKLTGTKPAQKMYYRFSGHPGGLREEVFEHIIKRRPEVPIEKAIKGMLPKSVLGRKMIAKLKVYGSDKHPHQAQKPEVLAV